MLMGKAVLSMTLFCLVLRTARCNSSMVDITSRFLRNPFFHIKITPEVQCALALLPSHFELSGNASAAQPRLYVFGQTDWLDEFLMRFPHVACVSLFTEDDYLKFSDVIFNGMLPSSSIALILSEPDPLLNIPYRVRTIYWISLPANVQLATFLSYYSTEGVSPFVCHRFVRALITEWHGATSVFDVQFTCDFTESPNRTFVPLGIWSLSSGWSPPGTSLFPPPCVTWRTPPDAQPIVAEMFSNEAIKYNDRSHANAFKNSFQYGVLKLLRASFGLDFKVRYNFTRNSYYPLMAADTCRLDLSVCASSAGSGTGLTLASHSEISVFPWDFHELIGVVPAGAGKPYHTFHSIIAEFTPAVWISIGVMMLIVAASLYLTRGRESVHFIVFLTVGPLFAQPIQHSRGAGPLLIVLGAWLLTCVVLVSAYQGQLLSLLRNPYRNRQIDSWQDYIDSNLRFLTTGPIILNNNALLAGLTNDRVRTGFTDNDMFSETVIRKKSGFLYDRNALERIIGFFPKEISSKMHVFSMKEEFSLATCFASTKGSPLERPLRKLLGRMRAAGFLQNNVVSVKKLQQNKRRKKSRKKKKRNPITAYNLRPVAWLFMIGNSIAFLTFILELSYAAVLKSILRVYQQRM